MEITPEFRERLDQFRERITTARREVGRQQKELAAALGFDDRVLSRKLHGNGRERLTTADIKDIIKILASWDAITSQADATELLALMRRNSESFSSTEWKQPPLNRLIPLAAVSPAPIRTPLPVPATPLIGRSQETTLVCELLRQKEVRLVTLTGPAGVGKTRLSLQVATELAEQFTDGVCFVLLSTVNAPDQVIPAINQALGLSDPGPQTPQTLLKNTLRMKHLLLILDNFEQVVEAAVQIATVIAACPMLKVLVSSRIVLHVQAEREFAVPSLAVPNAEQLPPLEEFMRYEAVALFIQRAQAVKYNFVVTSATAPILAAICTRLDGLPLAIELAAAHVKHFPLVTLLTRLEHGISVLSTRARDLPERQRTLYGALTWSYDLLSKSEQALFRRLAVFVGGCTWQAVAVVCRLENPQEDVLLEELAAMVDKSLLRQDDEVEEQNEPRFWMLHVLREFGLEQLNREGEAEVTGEAHATYYLEQAEEAASHLQEAGHGKWLALLDREYQNLRVALAWFLERVERGYNEQALRLCLALYLFWRRRGSISEARDNFAQALRYRVGVTTAIQALALRSAGMLAFIQDDLVQTEPLVQESLKILRELGDHRNMAYALTVLGNVAKTKCRYTEAHSYFEEALPLFQQCNDSWGVANTLVDLAHILNKQGHYERARVLYEEALALSRSFGMRSEIGYKLHALAESHFLAGADLWQVRSMAEESLALLKEAGDRHQSAYTLSLLSQIVRQQNDVALARQLAKESASIIKEVGDRQGLASILINWARLECSQGQLAIARSLYMESLSLLQWEEFQDISAALLEGIALLAVAQDVWADATQLLGFAAALREAIGTPLPPLYHAEVTAAVSTARDQLGADDFASTWATGQTLSLQQALVTLPPLFMRFSLERVTYSP